MKPAVDQPSDEIITAPQLAEELKVPLTTVYYWNRIGTGPVRIRVGRHVRYRRSAVNTWLEEQTA